MHTDSSAIATCLRLRSTVECTATVRMPRAWHARRMRSAILPRLAITTLSSMGFGIRDLGFGKGIRLADTAFVRADQGVEAGEGALAQVRGNGLFAGAPEAQGVFYLRGKLGQLPSRHGTETREFGSWAT